MRKGWSPEARAKAARVRKMTSSQLAKAHEAVMKGFGAAKPNSKSSARLADWEYHISDEIIRRASSARRKKKGGDSMSLNSIKALMILNAKMPPGEGDGFIPFKMKGKAKGWTKAARLKAALARKAKSKVKAGAADKKKALLEAIKPKKVKSNKPDPKSMKKAAAQSPKKADSKTQAKAVIQKAKKSSAFGQTEVAAKSKIEAKNATSTHAIRKQQHAKMTKKGFKLTSSHPNEGDVYKKRVGDHHVSVHVTPVATTGKGNLKYKGVSITSSTLKDAYSKHGYKESDKPAAKLADKTGE